MKKIIALILAMVMALSLVACGQTAQDDKSKDDANSTSAKTFIMGIDAEYPPSAIWMRTATTPDLTWRSARPPAICWDGSCRSSL